jgi:putative exporter of polyketide antibiotics
MKKIDLARHAPPGMELSFHRNLFEIGLVVAFLYSLKFLTRFSRLRSLLYDWDETGKTLREGAEMADFAYIVDGALLIFYILAFAMLMTAILNYAYHRQGSRSIYLMKRLPNRWELHRRCLTIPLVSAALCLLAAFVVLLLYFGYYMIATPEQCLTPDQWQKIWR